MNPWSNARKSSLQLQRASKLVSYLQQAYNLPLRFRLGIDSEFAKSLPMVLDLSDLEQRNLDQHVLDQEERISAYMTWMALLLTRLVLNVKLKPGHHFSDVGLNWQQ